VVSLLVGTWCFAALTWKNMVIFHGEFRGLKCADFFRFIFEIPGRGSRGVCAGWVAAVGIRLSR
jgi:hypothetical protein